MDNHEVETSPQTKPPDEFWGLLRQCPHCSEAVKAALSFNATVGNHVFLAVAVDDDLNYVTDPKKIKVCGPCKVHCVQCRNTRVVLTLKGRRLLGIIKTWFEEASPQWMAENEEFPF